VTLDDARSSAESPREPDRSDSVRRESEPRIRALFDRVPLRAVDRDRGDREHQLTLPSGAHREHVRDEGRTYRLRGSEVDLLERAARFRSVFSEDLQRACCGDHAGRVAGVIAVTSDGRTLLDPASA
jgi:hypothetical protein